MTPRISVLTPSFNQAPFIADCIESVQQQGYPDVEHIIVDGGSTDGTVDILRTYPHLRWTSEPDRGQSDALNKAVTRATGDVIAWLNSDDWYAPNVFAAVAQALADAPVVMGQCQMTDEHKRPTELIRNIEHDWFDVLKYWVYDSIPTQPSIFFRRSVLEDVRYQDGTYFDPELHFVMDFDLWLRLARRAPFTRRIDSVLSYYRMYDTNKTGGDWTLIFKEASRVFARHANIGMERRLSFVLPAHEDVSSLVPTLAALSAQSFLDFEVLLVASEGRVPAQSAIDRLALSFPALSLRCVLPSGDRHLSSLRRAAHVARAPVLCPLDPIQSISGDLALRLASAFIDDRVGVLLKQSSFLEGVRFTGRVDASSTNARDALRALLASPSEPVVAAVRLTALQDIGTNHHHASARHAAVEDVMFALYKGWCVTVWDAASATSDTPAAPGVEVSLTPYIAAQTIADLATAHEVEPFAKVRTEHAAAVRFEATVVDCARRLLTSAPGDWWRAGSADLTNEDVQRWTAEYPSFSPGLHLRSAMASPESSPGSIVDSDDVGGARQREDETLKWLLGVSISGSPMP